MSAGQRFPDVGSRWWDSEGSDGVITVVGREKGYVVAEVGDALGGEVIIQPGHFGSRYQAVSNAE